MSEDFFEDLRIPRAKAKRVGFSVSEEVAKEFDKFCKAKKYNKSKIIENFMKKFIEQEKSLIK